MRVSVPSRGHEFRYMGFDLTEAGVMTCRYDLDELNFTEQFHFESGHDADFASAGALAAARILFLLTGISYFKTRAPSRISFEGEVTPTPVEHQFLEEYYRHGLAEFSYGGGGVDIRDLKLSDASTAAPASRVLVRTGHPLVPFGGGIDSIVVAHQTINTFPETCLFVANTSDVPFVPIERTAAILGRPIHRVRRILDPQVLKSSENGFFNGHVPVTGILSAAAILSAVAHGHDSVIMSNEHSASVGTNLEANGVAVNHQWSKSIQFERGFRSLLDHRLSGVQYYSALRAYSELWVAKQFATLEEFHADFRSCNKAFFVDPAKRYEDWCGTCDKCCFIDLILAPYLPRTDLARIFGGSEPLDDSSLENAFMALLGRPDLYKPLECVGDADECQTAAVIAGARADRHGQALVQLLADYARSVGRTTLDEARLLERLSEDFRPCPNRS